MDKRNAELAAALESRRMLDDGTGRKLDDNVDEFYKAVKQSVGDLRAEKDWLWSKLAEKDQELVKTRGDLRETQEHLALALRDHRRIKYQRQPPTAGAAAVGAGCSRGLGDYYFLRDAEGEESPLRSNSLMTMTQLPPRGDDQLARAKRKRDAEAFAPQGEASFTPALCEACNVMMEAKDVCGAAGGARLALS